MSDIKLFRITNGDVVELAGSEVALEKRLQVLMEENLDELLGVRFLASEFITGKKHGGRIDSIGIDENNCPVIIEYKRSKNENVINQGLYYLDWLMDHRGDYKVLVIEKLGTDAAASIDWSQPRLICVAGDFTKYDEYAVQQIDRNIELYRYKRFGDDLLILELVNAVESSGAKASSSLDNANDGDESTINGKASKQYTTFQELLDKADPDLKALFEEARSLLLNLGDDVQEKELLYYRAFKRIKNFVCVEVHPNQKTVVLYVKVDPSTIPLEKGFTRDLTNLGHLGTGDLEVRLRSLADLERAKEWIVQSYENS